nr:dTDP-4-dehydrorhamnose reductase [Cohnella sp. REN36]
MVTGAGGQLGREIVGLNLEGIRFVGIDRQALDITNGNQTRQVIHELRPDAIIHAAAYTAVDKAESEPDAAYSVNAIGTRNVALASDEVGAKFCYISTDYVFDGTGTRPYETQDAPAPRTVYGRTKLEGERFAEECCRRSFIVRTSWVYGKHGANFVKTMLQLANQRSEVTVVQDQIGSPTFTLDLALFLAKLVVSGRFGVYHASNTGTCSWFEFAKAIFEEAEVKMAVHPCSTEQFPRPAPRPAYSVLGHEALLKNGFEEFRHWRDALKDYFKR